MAPVAGVPVMPASPNLYGGFWIRFLAVLIDGILINLLVWPIVMVVGGAGAAGLGNLQDNPEAALPVIFGMLALIVPLVVAAGWLYEALMTASSWQGTVGKHILGLRVTDDFGNRIGFARATGRHFSKILSGIMCIGYIMAAFTERKKALHDMIAGTLVMKR